MNSYCMAKIGATYGTPLIHPTVQADPALTHRMPRKRPPHQEVEAQERFAAMNAQIGLRISIPD